MGCGQSKIGSIYPRKSKHKNGKKRGDTEADSEEDAEDADYVVDAAAASCEAEDKLTAASKPRQVVTSGPLLAHTEISSSQVDFFRMLDEKIESGPDYNSSEEEEVEKERVRIMSLLQDWENASLNSARSRSAPATPVLRKLNPQLQTNGEILSPQTQKLPDLPGVLHQPKSVPHFAQQQVRDDACQYYKDQHQMGVRGPGYQQSARDDVYRHGSNRDLPYQVGMDGMYYPANKDSPYLQKQQQDRENMYQQVNNRKIPYQPPYMDQAYHLPQNKSGILSHSNKDMSYQQRSWDRTQQSVRESYYYQPPRDGQCPTVYRELPYQPSAQDGLYQYVNNRDVIYQQSNKEAFQQVGLNRNVMFQQPRKEMVFQQPTSRPNTPSFQVPVQKPIKDALFQQRHQPNPNVTFQHPIRDDLVQQHAKSPMPFQQSGVAAFHRPCRDMPNIQDPNIDLPYQHVPRSVPVTQPTRSKDNQFQHVSKEQVYQQLQRTQPFSQVTRGEQFQDSDTELAFQQVPRATFLQPVNRDDGFQPNQEMVLQDVQRTMFHQQDKADGQFEQTNNESVFQQPPRNMFAQQISREGQVNQTGKDVLLQQVSRLSPLPQTSRDEQFQQSNRMQHALPHPPNIANRNYQPVVSQHASSVVQYKKSRGAYTELA